MKKLLVIILLVFAAQLQAQVRIGQGEAFSTATRFLHQNVKQRSTSLSLSEVVHSKQTGLPNLYVFTVNPRGFILVSATGEVLAYSLNSSFPKTDELPDHIAYWIDLYNNTTDYIIEHHLLYLQRKTSRQEVEPLLTSAWGQGCFHNELCPFTGSGPCHHASAGCVAIAMAQIMYYHKLPLKGYGEVSYESPYGILSANFGETVYPWDEMSDTLHESNLAVALLVSHCGISAKMDYSPHSSGSSITKALTAFQDHFFYPSSRILQRSDTDDEGWISRIKNDLDKHLPVYYRGHSYLGGHAFVCDGYDNNGLFHFNFGWDGVADGYYTLEDPSGFSDNQAIIYDIAPVSSATINSDSHGIIYVSPDGTGDGSSWEQATSELQSALCKSQSDHLTIWAKEGTYTGTGLGDYCFYIFGNYQIYGGFNGDEPFNYDLSLRAFEAHPSILDGNHMQGLINAQHCDSILIDGFIIQNGSAPKGGGITTSCNTSIKNCIICNNQAQTGGGGVAFTPSDNASKILVEDCEFYENEAKNGGAIFYDGNGQSQFERCQIHNNTAQLGGGVYSRSKASFWSCLINNNTAETGGGCNIKGETNLYNCTIVKNEGLVEYGGLFYSKLSMPGEIKNCIIWGNISQDGNTQIGPLDAYTCCAVEGSPLSSSHNFNAESENDGQSPNFYVRFNNADVTAGSSGFGGDWRLQPNSLCIGRADSIAFQPASDLYGNPRLRHSKVDLGAYESNTVANVINRLFCDGNYYYNGTLLTSPGAYSFFYPDAAYDSLVVIHLDREIINKQDFFCENETFDFFGQMLNEPGHYSYVSDCMIYELDLFINPISTEIMEAEICEGESYNFHGETLHEPGHYSTTLDCKNYELDLIVSPMPIVTMEEEICSDETYNFFGQKLNKAGHYSTTKDCQAYELDLSVIPQPELHCSNDTLIEYGSVVQLSASGADSYLWSTGETTESITVAPKEDMTYTVTGFSENGCKNSTRVNIRVNLENQQIVMFPNPASSRLEIYMPFIDAVNVFNLLGEEVFQANANREAVELDVSQFPNGVYIIQIKQLKNLFYEKLIVQH